MLQLLLRCPWKGHRKMPQLLLQDLLTQEKSIILTYFLLLELVWRSCHCRYIYAGNIPIHIASPEDKIIQVYESKAKNYQCNYSCGNRIFPPLIKYKVPCI